MVYPTSIPEYFLLIIFLTWAFFSILCQGTNKYRNKIKRIDMLNIVPNYKFFCPNPIRYDYHLYYKQQERGKRMTDWKEIPIAYKRSLICMFWNPSNRDRKVFYRIVQFFKNPNNLKKNFWSNPFYKGIVRYIKTNAESADAMLMQFRITYKQDLNKESEELTLYTSHVYDTRLV